MKSKRQMRKSMRVSTSTANDQDANFVDKDEEASNSTPTRAYTNLDGQKKSGLGE